MTPDDNLCFDNETRTTASGVYVPCWAFDLAARYMERAIRGDIFYQDLAVDIALARKRGRDEVW